MDAVDVDGLRIAYRRAGSGDPLLILHGGLEDSRLWIDDIERLSTRLDVIAWDAPGCGASDDVPDGWRSDDWGRVAASLIDALGLHQPAVAGLSFGSVVALLLARDRPDALGALVLIGGYAGWAGSLAPADLEKRIASVRDTIERPAEEWADDFLNSVYSPDAAPSRRNLARMLIDHWRPQTTAAMLDTMVLDLRDVLDSIQTPTFVVRGSADERSPRAASLELVERMPHARLREIAGAGHDCAGPELDEVLVQAAHEAASRR
ncbi:alpha/beta fold hydrolase [Microbacterium hominis]|uniref:Alpha/beta hydrolase n=1 Tax=Microbacterium hominis TaxID=162426 RepID=A0A7D4UKG5_9MICO|nr:alpha/beta hydrolase [Microbacterium hominis]QKJ20847.1 alpha/beta hydrolase [Microbacterium hominis]